MKTFTNRLLDLLQKYEELAALGTPPAPEVVCADDPELLSAFVHALQQLDLFHHAFLSGTSSPPTLPMGDPTIPGASTLPGYELEAKLGEGGMGVVYRALQVRGRRTVALKMIKAGDHASARTLARFQTEAEAVARLQHPNIVQVFEISEHAGQPFFTMEFCAGGSLAQRLGQETLQPREAATLVRTLALAMQAAHEAHVLHRDLKPGNVLLTADGQPKLSDFGLAKKLDEEEGQTHTGEVLGTPSFMAPEQARGDNDLGPAVDIYALGAILYACLTGRAPFRAATSMETVWQVLNTEPASVRQLNPSVPRDLETICHKCLQKEPGKRYATARELADDLERFLEGRPIAARPVGTLERGWRWCKRNPALALALTAAVVFLVGGAATAYWYARLAGQRADDLAHQVVEYGRKVDELEGALAQRDLSPLSLVLRPLNEQEWETFERVATQRGQPQAWRFLREGMTDPNMRSRLPVRAEYFWHAALGLDRRRRAEAERFLLAELPPGGSRGDPPHLAAGSRGDPPHLARQHEELALAAAALGGLSPEGAAAVVTTLKHSLTPTDTPESKQRLLLGLQAMATVGSRLKPAQAGEIVRQLGRSLNQTMDLMTVVHLTRAISSAGTRLEPEAVAEVANLILAAMNKSTDQFALEPFRGCLAVVVERLEPVVAVKFLAEAISGTPNPLAVPHLTKVLVPMVGRLDPAEAGELVPEMARLQGQPLRPAVVEALTEGLRGAVGRLDPRASSPVCAQAAGLLIQRLDRNPDPATFAALTTALRTVVQGLDRAEATEPATRALLAMASLVEPRYVPARWNQINSVAVRLGQKEASAVAARIVQAMNNAPPTEEMVALSRSLGAVLVRMEPQESAQCCTRAVAILRQAMRDKGGAPDPPPMQRDRELAFLAEAWSLLVWKLEPVETATGFAEGLSRTSNSSVLYHLTQGLHFNAARLAPDEVPPLATAILRTLDQVKETRAVEQLARGLESLARRLDAKAAATVADRLLPSMYSATDPSALTALLTAHEAARARLEPEEAVCANRPVLTLLVERMNTAQEPGPLLELSRLLARAVAGLDSAEAGQVCRPLAARLIPALRKATTSNTVRDLTGSLATLAVHLPAPEAIDLLTQVLITDAQGLQVLEAALVTLGPRLGQQEVTLALDRHFQALNQPAIRLETVLPLVRNVGIIAERLEADTAALAAASFTQQLLQPLKEVDARKIELLAPALRSIVVRMEPRAAVVFLTRTLNKANAPMMRELFIALSSVLGRLPAGPGGGIAARVACEPAVAWLVPALKTQVEGSPKPDAKLIGELAQALASATASLEPGEADRVCAPVASLLLEAMSKTRDTSSGGWEPLAKGLGAVVVRLEPRAGAATLLQAMRQMQNAYGLKLLSRELPAAVARLEAREVDPVCDQAAARLTEAMNGMTNPVGLAQLTEGLTIVVAPMARRAAARACARAAATFTQALRKSTDQNEVETLARTVPLLSAWLEPAEAGALLLLAMSRTMAQEFQRTLPTDLASILRRDDDRPFPYRRAAVAGTFGGLAGALSIGLHPQGGLLTAPALLQPAFESPAPVPTQTLVDLLKHPFCIGEGRRVVLVELSKQLGPRFADQWEFVNFAEEQKLGLDLLGPFRR
jgi:hypothetical protein